MEASQTKASVDNVNTMVTPSPLHAISLCNSNLSAVVSKDTSSYDMGAFMQLNTQKVKYNSTTLQTIGMHYSAEFEK